MAKKRTPAKKTAPKKKAPAKLKGKAAKISNARFKAKMSRQAVRDAGMDPEQVYDK